MSSLSPEARRLLDASRGAGGPSSAQRAAMKQAVLAAALVPGTAAASTVAGGAKATGLALAAKLGLAVVSAGVGAALIWQVVSAPTAAELPRAPAVAARAQQRAEAPLAATAPSAVAVPVAVRAEESAEVPLAPSAVVPAVGTAPRRLEAVAEAPRIPASSPPEPVAPGTREAPPAAPVDEATLSREIAALSGAMAAVDTKSYAVALEQLAHYRAAFPAGVLETEASVLEALALCGLGRVDEARAVAAPLPTNNPAVRRLERSCIASGGK